MYFKITYRHNIDVTKTTHHYRIVESYRNLNDRICHRTLLNVGNLDHLTKAQFEEIRIELTNRAEGKQGLFEIKDEISKKYIEEFWSKLVKEKKVDLPEETKEKREHSMLVSTMKHQDVREIGAEWIGYQGLEQLKIREYLQNIGWEEEQINLTITQLISRAVYPASEFKTTRWIRENSAVCEITEYPIEKITKDKLYQNALKLYGIKEGLEDYLSKRTNELFDLQDKILLYDLTNTYFEGEKRKSKLAQYGRSKEKRSDAKLIVLALVINQEGFQKYSAIYEGNKTDCNTLIDMVKKLSTETITDTAIKKLVILDAGIATDDNLALLEKGGYNYLCVRRSKLKEYQLIENSTEQYHYTQLGQRLSLQRVQTNKDRDYYIKVDSPGKKLKEASMKNKFETRFLLEIDKIKQSINKKHGTKKVDTVNRRIGKSIAHNPSVAHNYDIRVETNDKNIVTEIHCIRNEAKNKAKEDLLGVYFLRTNLPIQDEKLIWNTYNTIREIESTFRTIKTDIDLRPIYHKNDCSTLAHLNLGLLAYTLVNTIRFQLKAKDIHICWPEIVRIANTQKAITTIGKNLNDHHLLVRKCSEPTDSLNIIYKALNYKSKPFYKKSVGHKLVVTENNPLIVSHHPPS